MTLTRRDLLRAGGLVGLATIYTSRWALGSPPQLAGSASWLPPLAAEYPLDQGADLDPGLLVVGAAEQVGSGRYRQTIRHIFDNGCLEEQAFTWTPDELVLDRISLSFFGFGGNLRFLPPLPVVSAAGVPERQVSGDAEGMAYACTVRQRPGADALVHLDRRLEMSDGEHRLVAEQQFAYSPSLRLVVSGSTVVAAEPSDATGDRLEWNITN